MIKFILLILSIYGTDIYAEELETAGGYDYKAVERAETQEKERASAIERARQKKIKQAKQAKMASAEKAALLPENMAKKADFEACINAGKEWRKKGTENWISDIQRRKLRHDINSIKAGVIKIGNYDCDVFAVYGLPKDLNRTVNTHGTQLQFVYDHSYIYTDNGVITSWSD